MNNNTPKKMLGIAITGAATAAVVSHKITKGLVSLAVDRDSPKDNSEEHKIPDKIQHKAAAIFKGSETNALFTQTIESAARKLAEEPHEIVEITAGDGQIMKGHWFPKENASRIIIAMHGWRSSWSHDFGLISSFFKENGCSVLYPEQRGQGASGGTHIGLGILERFDCRDWIDWVNEHNLDGKPIYLAGVSMGATTVLMTSGLELPNNVSGIIADCGFTSPHDISKHIVENNLHMSYGIRGQIADTLCKEKNQIGTKAYSSVCAMKENRIPVLFIHGADDTFVPVTMTYENYKACAAPKELLIVPGADHAMSYYVNREKYEEAVKAFWGKYD